MESLLTMDAPGLKAAVGEDLARCRAAVEAFKALDHATPALEVLRAWDRIGQPLNRSSGLVHLFFQAHPDVLVRDGCAELEQDLSRFHTELSLDHEAYARLAAIEDAPLPDPISARVLEHSLRDFRRAGVDRDEATRAQVRALRERLVEVGQDFSRNIASDVRSITLDGPEELEGLPADYIASHPVGDDGKITITTNPPDSLPFMQFCARREHRRALHHAMNQRAWPANASVLDELIAKRHELAQLLGFESWAAYTTDDKMIQSPQRAADFIERVNALAAPRSELELDELLAELKLTHPEAEGVRDYDRGYLVQKVKQRKFDFDVKDVRPYLPYDAVRDGVLGTVSTLYGVEIARRDDIPTWHEDVEVFDVRDGDTHIARFFLDMHPRPNKFKHAAMFDLAAGLEGEELPRACLVCNMPKPSADDAALLDPGQLSTFFHEVGHLMHHLLAGRHEWLSVSGIATEWDFVEVPSQLFEEWPRDPGVLASFTRHHETGEPLPDALVTRMNAAEDVAKGLFARGQMFYASLALECFRRDPAQLDVEQLVAELKPRYSATPIEPDTHFQTSFGHLEGYSALYYTYMWSLVLAKDVLSAFEGDLMNAETARRYREAILAPGGSKDAADLVADFLGRASDFAAFEAWLAA